MIFKCSINVQKQQQQQIIVTQPTGVVRYYIYMLFKCSIYVQEL